MRTAPADSSPSTNLGDPNLPDAGPENAAGEAPPVITADTPSSGPEDADEVQEIAAREGGDADHGPAAFPQGLTEYCQARSATDRRPELLAAFFAHETKHGRTKALSAEFDERFEAFGRQPA
jgi:hypothetical protein